MENQERAGKEAGDACVPHPAVSAVALLQAHSEALLLANIPISAHLALSSKQRVCPVRSSPHWWHGGIRVSLPGAWGAAGSLSVLCFPDTAELPFIVKYAAASRFSHS